MRLVRQRQIRSFSQHVEFALRLASQSPMQERWDTGIERLEKSHHQTVPASIKDEDRHEFFLGVLELNQWILPRPLLFPRRHLLNLL